MLGIIFLDGSEIQVGELGVKAERNRTDRIFKNQLERRGKRKRVDLPVVSNTLQQRFEDILALLAVVIMLVPGPPVYQINLGSQPEVFLHELQFDSSSQRKGDGFKTRYIRRVPQRARFCIFKIPDAARYERGDP
jgi:hypothetical protein